MDIATNVVEEKTLTEEEVERLHAQNSRLVDDHKANLLEIQAKKYWDLFYKRNENRFFKDRHWTTREFCELLCNDTEETKILFEVGCGVGNFFFPLIEENLNFDIVACDLSPRAVEIIRTNPLYTEDKIRVFQGDITSEEIFLQINPNSVDIATLIFVLSAIHPQKFLKSLKHISAILKPGGTLLFRDYGLYDMAQLRFKPGHKIAENFYMRQDGTRSYYFSLDEVESLFREAGFKIIQNSYIQRRTINKKENIDVPRVFVQTKALKS